VIAQTTGTPVKGDGNPNRIINGKAFGENELTYTLPSNLQLTAGQSYYWGVIATDSAGNTVRHSSSFHVASPAVTTPFSTVTIITSLVQENQEVGGNRLFNSPLHFIGHSFGTVVNSEIIQRLGTYFPSIADIQMTTLDPHDFNQPSLGSLGVHYDDLKTPAVT